MYESEYSRKLVTRDRAAQAIRNGDMFIHGMAP
jgi:hypothetical protein